MGSVQDSQLAFSDAAVNGDTVDQVAWNQNFQTLKEAINDNFYRIIEQFNLLNADGSTNKSMPVESDGVHQNVVQFQIGQGITISATQVNGVITFALSIANGAITESMLASGILQDEFYTRTQLDTGQLDTRYYTQSQTQALINSASSTATVATGTSFPASPVDGQIFYRDDLHQLYVYDAAQAQWNVSGKTYNAGTGINIDASNNITNTGVTKFNGQAGDVTYTAPVISVNGQTGEVTVTESVDSLLFWMSL